MAKVHPSSPAGSPLSEIRVRAALSQLEEDWRVFHSVAWQSRRGGRQADGEADFVAVHPSRGIVVIEVKGGAVAVVNGRWFSTDASTGERHAIKDPFRQATDSKYALLNYLDQLDPPIRDMPAMHAVIFRSASVESLIGMAAPREIIWDAADLTRPRESMERLLRHWNVRVSITPRQLTQIERLLAPTVQIRPRLRTAIAEAGEQLIILTQEQIRALNSLRRNRRAVVYGGAGTGKTILAVERARKLAEEGFTVLLTCFNRPLGEYLARAVSDELRITAMSFHSLCMSEMKKAWIRTPQVPSSEWWRIEAPEHLVEAAEANNRAWDAVVVDEGQDFPPNWFDSLLMLLREPDDGPCYVFADSQQAVYVPDWSLPETWPAFDLDVNCRNTLPIATRVARLFDVQPSSLGASGPEPRFVVVSSSQDVLEVVSQVVEHLIREERLDPQQIAVISDSRAFIDDLHGLRVAGKRFSRMDEGGIIAETIYRFKGMEADVVLAVLHGTNVAEGKGRSLAYVALSRARSYLVVLGSKDQAKQLAWPSKLVTTAEKILNQ